jgi:hypothetical protein
LREFARKPERIFAEARMNAAGGKKTIVVEGQGDVRFLKQWISESAIRAVASDGKDVVLDVLGIARRMKFNGLTCVVDLDFDAITHRPETEQQDLIYVSYGKLPGVQQPVLEAIDLDALIIRSDALFKFMCIKGDLDVTSISISELRERLRSVASVLGACRVIAMRYAKEKVARIYPLHNFRIEHAGVSVPDLGYQEDALIANFFSQVVAERDPPTTLNDVKALLNRHSSGWALCRGHDLSACLAFYLSSLSNRHVSVPEVEQGLKMAFEKRMLDSSVFGKLCIARNILKL